MRKSACPALLSILLHRSVVCNHFALWESSKVILSRLGMGALQQYQLSSKIFQNACQTQTPYCGGISITGQLLLKCISVQHIHNKIETKQIWHWCTMINKITSFIHFQVYESKSNAEGQNIISNSWKIIDTLVTGMVSAAGCLHQGFTAAPLCTS